MINLEHSCCISGNTTIKLTWYVIQCNQITRHTVYVCCVLLAHWGRDKMAAVSQTTLSNPFSWMKMFEFRLKFHWSWFLMPPSHCRECCLRTNTKWHSLRIEQHRIDSNYFALVRCHFRISSQANTNVLKCSKHSYWPCESILFVLHRRTSYQFVSVPIGSYLIVVHSYRFVVHSHWDSPPVYCDSVRCNTIRNDRIVVLDRTCSHWFV